MRPTQKRRNKQLSRHDDNEQTGICFFCRKNRFDCICADECSTDWDTTFEMEKDGHFDD